LGGAEGARYRYAFAITLTKPAQVRKRDGRLVPFEADRISRTRLAAGEHLGRPDAFLARELTDCIVHHLAAECDGGIPVIVLTTEPLGLPLLDGPFGPLTDSDAEVLRAVAAEAGGGAPARSAAVAGRVGRTQQRVIQVLNDLHARGYVERVGERGGWRLAPPSVLRVG
jgi:hypothetical protein